MNSTRQISIKELKQISEILLQKATQSGFNEINFGTDCYWLVSSDEREILDTKPKLIVGSLFDDLEELKKILDADNPATPVDFDRLANVLIAVGERISHSDKFFFPL